MIMLTGTAGCASAESGQKLVEVEYKSADANSSWEAEDAVQIAFEGSSAQITGSGAELSGGVLTISEEGDYLLEGAFSGRIVVDGGKSDKIRLILNGVSIESADSAAIFVLKADKATITLAEGADNAIVSGGNLLVEDDEELDAAVYSKADLVINGSGSLSVTSEAGHGILSKDDLRIISGSIQVNAAEDGLRGRDAFMMTGGSVQVVSGGDGVKSNNEEDAERGYVSIDGGELNITSGEDGVQAETILQITGGNVAVDAKDDALNATTDLMVSGGSIVLRAGDDGVHADETLTVCGGSLTVENSNEGLEAAEILISGGETHVTANDDGLNAAGGNDDSAGWGMFAAGDYEIRVTGGTLYVDAGGDGIDSNGAIFFEGGKVYVSGPVNRGNGALDANGQMTASGGVLLATGAAGMAAAPSSNGQASSMVFMNGAQQGGKTVRIVNAAGEEVASFTPVKPWECIVISAPGLTEGESMSIYVDNELVQTATVGENAGSGGMHGFGGGRGGKRR